LNGGLNTYNYVESNPLVYFDSLGLTVESNWDFFWDWFLEHGPQRRYYGPNSVETQELMNSTAAEYMREVFEKSGCENKQIEGYSTGDAFLDSGYRFWSTDFQVGGFIWSAINSHGVTKFSVYNQASIYSFFYHIPGLPHKPRSPSSSFPFGGNIDQKFQWTEPNLCECK